MNRCRIALATPALAAMLVVTTIPAGCTSDADPEAPSDDAVGAVTLPLVSHANGHTYRLRNMYINISGPQFAQLFDSGDPTQTALSTTLATGAYTAFLYAGWTLERDDETAGFVPVVATLASNPSVNFTIFNGTTSTISYTFQTDGVVVIVGSGALRVTATIDEIGAVCTPLGSDCGSGAWCPPTTLTGKARACVAEGATPLGAACASPTECVANASCFDFGDGPVCSALCRPSEVGGPCEAGGICEALSAEHGVCRPAAEAP